MRATQRRISARVLIGLQVREGGCWSLRSVKFRVCKVSPYFTYLLSESCALWSGGAKPIKVSVVASAWVRKLGAFLHSTCRRRIYGYPIISFNHDQLLPPIPFLRTRLAEQGNDPHSSLSFLSQVIGLCLFPSQPSRPQGEGWKMLGLGRVPTQRQIIRAYQTEEMIALWALSRDWDARKVRYNSGRLPENRDNYSKIVGTCVPWAKKWRQRLNGQSWNGADMGASSPECEPRTLSSRGSSHISKRILHWSWSNCGSQNPDFEPKILLSTLYLHW